MKFLFDFFPLIAFYAAYKIYNNDILVATGAIIIATIIQTGYNWFKHRKVEKMHVITLALVVVFGGATLLLQDDIYIKWKVSVVNWLFAAVFFGSHFVGEKTIVERMLESAISVEKKIWTRLNVSWALFFISMGFLNWYVFETYSQEAWVDFKVYGMLGLTFLFVVLQGIYLSRHITLEEEPEEKPSED